MIATQMQAKVNSVYAARYEWCRGAISVSEFARRADVTDEQFAEIAKLSRYTSPDRAYEHIANVLYPVAR